MYGKCGLLLEMREIFEELALRDVVTWTALIAGYAEYGPAEEALKCYDEMQLEGISPNIVTIMCALKACGIVKNLKLGEDIEAQIRRKSYWRRISFLEIQ